MNANIDNKAVNTFENQHNDVEPKRKNWYQGLTIEEYKQKKKRREQKENAVMMKLFVSILIAVILLIIVAVSWRYIW